MSAGPSNQDDLRDSPTVAGRVSRLPANGSEEGRLIGPRNQDAERMGKGASLSGCQLVVWKQSRQHSTRQNQKQQRLLGRGSR